MKEHLTALETSILVCSLVCKSKKTPILLPELKSHGQKDAYEVS